MQLCNLIGVENLNLHIYKLWYVYLHIDETIKINILICLN